MKVLLDDGIDLRLRAHRLRQSLPLANASLGTQMAMTREQLGALVLGLPSHLDGRTFQISQLAASCAEAIRRYGLQAQIACAAYFGRLLCRIKRCLPVSSSTNRLARIWDGFLVTDDYTG